MKELVIISGKGGTGKTSLTAAFAALAGNHLLCDADVDAADLHLLMHPEIKTTTPFMGGGVAGIRPDACTGCGTCLNLCRFGAISQDFTVRSHSCEGCGVCVDLCPERAIDFPVRTSGNWFISETRFGPMVHARLNIAEENSGKLVSLIRRQARFLADEHHLDLIITDGPPGIGCPVIASISGASALLIVIEPTVSGMHDLRRVADLAAHFAIPAMICINKHDINPGISREIRIFADRQGLRIVGAIPFDPSFTRAMIAGQSIVEYGADPALINIVAGIWNEVCDSDHFSSMTPAKTLPKINH